MSMNPKKFIEMLEAKSVLFLATTSHSFFDILSPLVSLFFIIFFSLSITKKTKKTKKLLKGENEVKKQGGKKVTSKIKDI